jgi:hypothetical protein
LLKWVSDFQKKNASELIYQFILYGRIAEAADLSIEYINAFLGHGSDHFGFMCGKTTNPCFPITVIDILLRELQNSASQDVEYEEVGEKFFFIVLVTCKLCSSWFIFFLIHFSELFSAKTNG